ncbi:MAG: sigma-54 interaction domain-containing protein, partial [Thermodesulfovibrionales bacterium]
TACPFCSTLSYSSIFFIMDDKCNILSLSEKAKEACALTNVSIGKKLFCDAVMEGFPLYDCPPKSFGISHGFLKTAMGRVGGIFIYYPIKNEDGKTIGSIWNFIKHNNDMPHLSEEISWATKNKIMSMTLQKALISAKENVPVTIFGETGTGKTELAKFIHNHSQIREGPFLHINCSAIPETLFESELFGYKKGAFTGAGTEKKGYIALAEGGTLFLDEISDMPFSCQAKLLTFLDSNKYRPLGAVREKMARLRIISSSNKPLWEMVKRKEFREDLFFRISVVKLFIPPLRERKEDIPLLVKNYLKGKKYISPEAMSLLLSHTWPGNLRELFSVLESALICSAGEETIMPEHICFDYYNYYNNDVNLVSPTPIDERQKILLALRNSHNNKTRAARTLGISRVTLWRKITKYNITADDCCGLECDCHKP